MVDTDGSPDDDVWCVRAVDNKECLCQQCGSVPEPIVIRNSHCTAFLPASYDQSSPQGGKCDVILVLHAGKMTALFLA